MRWLLAFLASALLVPAAVAQEKVSDYPELSHLIQGLIVKQIPPELQRESNWGNTIPAPPNLRLPRLRTYINAGDHLEVPHGTWLRAKGKIPEPDKNLEVHVRDFKLQKDGTYRLVFDIDTPIVGAGEWQQWQKGLMLLDVTADAEARFHVGVTCDVKVDLDFKKFPPGVSIEPKIADVNPSIADLRLAHLGPGLERGENVQRLVLRLEDMLNDTLQQRRDEIRDQANQVIARNRGGRDAISADALLKLVPPSSKSR